MEDRNGETTGSVPDGVADVDGGAAGTTAAVDPAVDPAGGPTVAGGLSVVRGTGATSEGAAVDAGDSGGDATVGSAGDTADGATSGELTDVAGRTGPAPEHDGTVSIRNSNAVTSRPEAPAMRPVCVSPEPPR